ncbi:MAG: HAD family phosphatase [Anaerolineales bacterium]|nr:MAG: HAD family phosphatase [Anaerolineales bacterium]
MKMKDLDLSKYGVLWDLDGVLIESSRQHLESWMSVLPRFGLTMSMELHEQTFGMNNREILTIMLGEPPEADLLRRISWEKESAFREIIRGTVEPLMGAVELLEQLHSAKVRQAIASSAPEENIHVVVDALQIRGYFQVLVSGHDLPAKPDPAVYLEAARQIELGPEACVVVEDAVVGVRGAKKAGMRAVGVTTTHPASALQSADLIVESLLDLTADEIVQLLIN